MDLSDILKIGTPSLLGIIAAYVTYRLGRRARRDELHLQRAFDARERIAQALQELNRLHDHGVYYYAARSWDTQEDGAHLLDHDLVSRYTQAHRHLLAELDKARLYLPAETLRPAYEYLSVGNVFYSSASPGYLGLDVGEPHPSAVFIRVWGQPADHLKRRDLFDDAIRRLRATGL